MFSRFCSLFGNGGPFSSSPPTAIPSYLFIVSCGRHENVILRGRFLDVDAVTSEGGGRGKANLWQEQDFFCFPKGVKTSPIYPHPPYSSSPVLPTILPSPSYPTLLSLCTPTLHPFSFAGGSPILFRNCSGSWPSRGFFFPHFRSDKGPRATMFSPLSLLS